MIFDYLRIVPLYYKNGFNILHGTVPGDCLMPGAIPDSLSVIPRMIRRRLWLCRDKPGNPVIHKPVGPQTSYILILKRV